MCCFVTIEYLKISVSLLYNTSNEKIFVNNGIIEIGSHC